MTAVESHEYVQIEVSLLTVS